MNAMVPSKPSAACANTQSIVSLEQIKVLEENAAVNDLTEPMAIEIHVGGNGEVPEHPAMEEGQLGVGKGTADQNINSPDLCWSSLGKPPSALWASADVQSTVSSEPTTALRDIAAINVITEPMVVKTNGGQNK